MQRKDRPSLDPVLVVGVLLSVGLSVFFYLYQDIPAAIATFSGLLGIIITLQIQAMNKDRQRAERESRLGSMVAKLDRNPWLADVVESMLGSAERVGQLYGGSPAEDAYRQTLEKCRVRLTELENGRFHYPYSDNELNLALCESLQREFLAISVPTIDLTWWLEPEGQRYWRAQREALSRGATIRRVFVHSGWSEELETLARGQQQAGVQVRRIHQDRLPVGRRGIIGIWDGRCGVEVIYDASGQAVLFAFTVATGDLSRLRRNFEFVERLAVGLDEPEPTAGLADPLRGR